MYIYIWMKILYINFLLITDSIHYIFELVNIRWNKLLFQNTCFVVTNMDLLVDGFDWGPISVFYSDQDCVCWTMWWQVLWTLRQWLLPSGMCWRLLRTKGHWLLCMFRTSLFLSLSESDLHWIFNTGLY